MELGRVRLAHNEGEWTEYQECRKSGYEGLAAVGRSMPTWRGATRLEAVKAGILAMVRAAGRGTVIVASGRGRAGRWNTGMEPNPYKAPEAGNEPTQPRTIGAPPARSSS